MTRYIDADDIQFITVPIAPLSKRDHVHYEKVVFKQGIDNAPTIDAVPVRHGHWIKEFENEDGRNLRCSECRMVFYVGKGRDGNYCPECGARMDEVEK